MHLPNLKKLGDKFDLRSVVSRTGLSARTAAERFGFSTASTDFQAVLDDPQVDLVLIATRHDLHSEMTLAALKAGKHVFVEKPTSMTEEGLDAIEAFYADNPNGPLLMTGFNRRFAPAVTAAREAIKGRLSPMIVNYRMNAGYIPSDHWVHGPHGEAATSAKPATSTISSMRSPAASPSRFRPGRLYRPAAIGAATTISSPRCVTPMARYAR